MTIKVFEVRDERKKDSLKSINVRIGDWEAEVPIRFIRVSEITNLEDLLRRAYELGQSAGTSNRQGNRGPDSAIANEKSNTSSHDGDVRYNPRRLVQMSRLKAWAVARSRTLKKWFGASDVLHN